MIMLFNVKSSEVPAKNKTLLAGLVQIYIWLPRRITQYISTYLKYIATYLNISLWDPWILARAGTTRWFVTSPAVVMALSGGDHIAGSPGRWTFKLNPWRGWGMSMSTSTNTCMEHLWLHLWYLWYLWRSIKLLDWNWEDWHTHMSIMSIMSRWAKDLNDPLKQVSECLRHDDMMLVDLEGLNRLCSSKMGHKVDVLISS